MQFRMKVSPPDTPNIRLATMLLGRPVLDWVREKRAEDPQPSWTAIAEELNHRTNGAVVVTREAIRQWVNPKQAAA